MVVGGIQVIVDILNVVDRGIEKRILEVFEFEDVEFVEEIRKCMFVFEDIVKFDNRFIQRILCEVENNILVIVFKGIIEEVCKVIFSNMLKCMVEMI